LVRERVISMTWRENENENERRCESNRIESNRARTAGIAVGSIPCAVKLPSMPG